MKDNNICLEISLLFLFMVIVAESRSNNTAVLSRKRRYLVFPEGTSVSIAVCMTAQTGVIPPGIFTESIAWGLAYNLPDKPDDFKDILKYKHIAKRRQRRELYGKMETILNSMGYDGRSCILRALCEASYRFLPKENDLFRHILKIVFLFPQEPVLPSEPDEHHIYHWAYRKGTSEEECLDLFTQCPFSLIDMALGYYSEPETNELE
ncbi:hypothetical protein NQ317_016765 [Molorchus minor]|uniref:Uncharacterized protein n=1 Tax=Molorchus minor TaxID=1323400 RepID=A0ABQ9JPH2_9CUCU|nr:hypothetical protein NQ317_016765 [Molorchus minor]